MTLMEFRARRRTVRTMCQGATLGLLLLASACSSGPSESAAPAAGAGAPEVAAHDDDHEGGHAAASGRVFFVAPKDGATVKSPVRFEFGAEEYTIAAVPEGTVEHPRTGTGHFHLGVDADCLPAGEVIPKGTPGWVHFGKGDNTIDMQLTPGTHRFSVQAGDDQHRTAAGLCETISITVEP